MSLNFDSPTFTGIVRAQALNVGSSTTNDNSPMINSGLIINPNFSNPSIANNTSQNIGTNSSLIQWNFSPNSENDYLVLNRNDGITGSYFQYLSVSSTNGILSQTLNINKATNYQVTANIFSFSQNTIEVLLNNVVVATWEVTSSWNTFSANFPIQNLGNNVLGFRNITNNAVYNISGITLFVQEVEVGNVSLDVSGNVFVQSGFVINKENNSSSMSIISNNLNLNSNTNVTSNLKLSYLRSGVVRSDNNGNLTSGIVSNAETSANVQPLANTIMLRDGNGFSNSATPALTSNNTTVATTQFVQSKINELVDNAPEMMNTLGELATAISQSGGTQLLQAINLKADKTYVDTNLSTKVNNSAYLTAINNINNSISGNKQKADVSLNALNSSLNTLRQGTDVSLNALNQSITDQITNGSYAGNYANVGDVANYKNKLVRANNDGDIVANIVSMSKPIMTGLPIVDNPGVNPSGDTGYVLVNHYGVGDIAQSKIKDRHVDTNANIAGSKLANNSIPLAKIATSAYSTVNSNNTLVQRNNEGIIEAHNIKLPDAFGNDVNSLGAATNKFASFGSNGQLYTSNVRDAYVDTNANIAGSKLANSSIPLAKIATSAYSTETNANTLVQRDNGGGIKAENIYLPNSFGNDVNSLGAATNKFASFGSNGYLYTSNVRDAYVDTNANIAGSKLADNSIPLAKMADAASYAGNYMNIDDINGYKNKLIKRNNDGDFAANTAALNAILLKGLQDSTAWGGDSGKLLASVNNTGDVSKTQIKDRHVASDADIAGSKLANNSIAVAKLMDVSSAAVANNLVIRDGNGCVLTATVAQSDNSEKAASTEFVRTAVNNLINGANINLDTLNELANAIGNDASFVTTVTDRLGSLDASVNLKADDSAVTSALALKADQSVVDGSFADVATALALKADQSAVTSALALKADQSAVTSALALKADQSVVDGSFADVDTALALKADQSVVDGSFADVATALALKADQSVVDGSFADVDTALALKAEQSAVDSSLNLKADQSYVDSSLNLKADLSYVDASLNLKADASYVDMIAGLKPDKYAVDTSFNLKADLSYVDGSLNLKANQSDISLINSELLLKADISYVNFVAGLKPDKYAVDISLNLKADRSVVDASLNLKADLSYVDSSLNLKVDTTVLADYTRIIATAPTAVTDAGTKGDIAFDSTYMWICLASGNWKRIALS